MKKVWFIVNCEKVFKALSGLRDRTTSSLREQTRDWESVPFEIEVGTICGKEGDTFYVESPSLPSDSYLWEVDGIDVFPHTAKGRERALLLAEKLTKEFKKSSQKKSKNNNNTREKERSCQGEERRG